MPGVFLIDAFLEGERDERGEVAEARPREEFGEGALGGLRVVEGVARFPVLAGIDVARRALDPKLPLRPGFVTCTLGFPPGFARNTFATITSLLPGSVPVDEAEGVLIYHCLDTAAPVVEQLWKEERLLAKALSAGRRDG